MTTRARLRLSPPAAALARPRTAVAPVASVDGEARTVERGAAVAMGDAPPSPERPGVASYLRLPRDSEKVSALRAELAAFQLDHGLPGGRYEERPENLRARPKRRLLVERARRGGIDCVVVLRFEHLSQNEGHLARIIRSLGVPVIAANGGTVDPGDSFVTWVARGRERQRKRSRRSIEERQQRGERTGGIPFGYQLDADGVHLVPAPAEQRTISRAVELRQSGMSYRRVAATLNEEGHRARGGGRITHGQVIRWLARAR